MKILHLGNSSLGQPIWAFDFPAAGPKVLILGGVHGDEIEGVVAAEALLERLHKSNPFRLHLTVIPRFNPDGVLLKTRGNGAGVDLNRNLPTQDWSPEAKTPRYFPGPAAGSEPENRILMAWLEKNPPAWLLSLHSWEPVLNVNGDCRRQAEVIAQHTGYRIDDDIGYPTPGCLGTYAGLERGLPTLTYEIERGSSIEQILKLHPPAIWAALQSMETPV